MLLAALPLQFQRLEGEPPMSVTTSLTVVGMTCQHCVRAVTEEIASLAGVEHVDVDLPTGLVTVSSSSPLGEGDLRHAVAEAGYEVAGR